jgi:hypothetical protein
LEGQRPSQTQIYETARGPIKGLWNLEEAAAELPQRLEKIDGLIPINPVSEKYVKAEVGKVGRKDYTESFFAAHGEKLRHKIEVHRAVEDWVHKLYPGLFTADEINSLANLRGIPKDGIGTALHRSKIRKEWNYFYENNMSPTKEQVLDYATKIDRKYGGLFIPPL